MPFQITKDVNRHWWWELVDDHSNLISKSFSWYATRDEAISSVQWVKQYAPTAAVFDDSVHPPEQIDV